MPNVTLHLVLADRVLEGWRQAPSTAPFSPRDPIAVNAFRQGALGPDLGYFPGGHRFLSDLAHCVRAADLCRALLAGARSSRDVAFAWGWATHVLADQAIHPWVGRGVGELHTGRRDLFVAADRDPAGHVRVETGVDAWYAVRHPLMRWWTPDPVFDGGSVDFLARAYRETYDLQVDPTLLLTSHLAVTRMSVQAVRTIAVLGDALRWEEGGDGVARMARGALDGVRRCLGWATGRESLLLALLTPVPPSPWLLEGVDAVSEGFVRRFQRHVGAGGALLENRNLDTGSPDGTEEHRGTAEALRVLQECGGRGLGARPVGESPEPGRYRVGLAVA